MATINEDYVSFEIAKLLKEKGFDVPTRSHYDGLGGFGFLDICEINWNNYKCFKERGCYSAPTLQMAVKWLRIEHNIHCVAAYRESDYYEPQIVCLGEWVDDKELDGCFSHEGAIKAAIKYCLEKLI